MIETASVMRPSTVIASASSKGTQRTARSSVGSGAAVPSDRPVASHSRPSSSVIELDKA